MYINLWSVLFIFVIIFLNALVYPDEQSANKLSGCDFDLIEENPDIVEYLPKECKDLTSNKNSDEYKILLEEARAFAKFHAKLTEYEKLKDPHPPIESDGSGIPRKQWAFRNETYSQNDFYQCIKKGSIIKDSMSCMIELRQRMIESIPQAK